MAAGGTVVGASLPPGRAQSRRRPLGVCAESIGPPIPRAHPQSPCCWPVKACTLSIGDYLGWLNCLSGRTTLGVGSGADRDGPGARTRRGPVAVGILKPLVRGPGPCHAAPTPPDLSCRRSRRPGDPRMALARYDLRVHHDFAVRQRRSQACGGGRGPTARSPPSCGRGLDNHVLPRPDGAQSRREVVAVTDPADPTLPSAGLPRLCHASPCRTCPLPCRSTPPVRPPGPANHDEPMTMSLLSSVFATGARLPPATIPRTVVVAVNAR